MSIDNQPQKSDVKIVTGLENHVTKVYNNTDVEHYYTTIDKVDKWFYQYAKHIEKGRNWLVPLGFILTLIIAFLTSDFHAFLIFKII